MFSKNYRLSLILTGQYQHSFRGCQPSSKIPHQIKSTQARFTGLMIQRAQATSMSVSARRQQLSQGLLSRECDYSAKRREARSN